MLPLGIEPWLVGRRENSPMDQNGLGKPMDILRGWKTPYLYC